MPVSSLDGYCFIAKIKIEDGVLVREEAIHHCMEDSMRACLQRYDGDILGKMGIEFGTISTAESLLEAIF